MKKQMILLSLFLVTGLFLSPVQAANPEICPNPNSSETPPVVESSKPSTVIYPMARKEASQEVKAEAGEVGYTCKVLTVETEGYKNEEEGDVYVQWTLVKKEGMKEIWAAHTERWGPLYVYVGDVEDGFYTFKEAENVCKDKEIVLNGETHRIKMTLPEIGFGIGGSDIDNLLNFEFLKYLNYTSVVSNRDQTWFWSGSSSFSHYAYAWGFHPASGHFDDDLRYYLYSVRCVGR